MDQRRPSSRLHLHFVTCLVRLVMRLDQDDVPATRDILKILEVQDRSRWRYEVSERRWEGLGRGPQFLLSAQPL